MTQSQITNANSLMSEWRTLSQLPRMNSMAAMARLTALEGYKAQSSSGDLALLYQLAKLLAPDDSAVREGELDNMTKLQGWFRDKGMLPERLTAGETLKPEMRREVWVMVDAISRTRFQAYAHHSLAYAEIADARGLKAEWVIPEWNQMNLSDMRMRPTFTLLRKMKEIEIVIKQEKDEQALEKAKTSMNEIQSELRSRLGVQPSEKLMPVIKWWIKGRKEINPSIIRQNAIIERQTALKESALQRGVTLPQWRKSPENFWGQPRVIGRSSP